MITLSGTLLREKRDAIGLSQAKLAELSGVPQHILSAFELGKAELSKSHTETLTSLFQNKASLDAVITRRKRYRNHTYAAVVHDPIRVGRHTVTTGNQEYKLLINSLHNRPIDARYSALSLFSGCGGLSLGFQWAGFKINGFVELEPHLQAIYKDNFPSTLPLGGDIAKISDADIHTALQKFGEIDILIGGPPCQGFSLSGKRDINDPRNTLFMDYLRFVKIFRPKVAVMENVRLLTSMKSHRGGFVRDEIQNAFRESGYSVRYFEVNAKDYGVPQHRERVIFVGIRDDLGVRPSFPSPTHSEHGNLLLGLHRYRTFADACSDLQYLESGENSPDRLHTSVAHPQHVIDWLWNVPEGFSAHDNEDPKLRPPSGYNTTYKRQIWLEPAATIQTTFGMISGCRNVHPISTRSLTIREAARIQSFPDSFIFKGTQGAIRTGIGNAVPPLLAYHIASHIRDCIL